MDITITDILPEYNIRASGKFRPIPCTSYTVNFTLGLDKVADVSNVHADFVVTVFELLHVQSIVQVTGSCWINSKNAFISIKGIILSS